MSKKKKKQDQQQEMEAMNNGELENEASEEAFTDQDAGTEEPLEVVEEPELSPLEVAERERDEFKEKWLRVLAELDNVRKRSSRQVMDSRRFAQADALRSFLEVHDNFERALQSMGDAGDTGEPQGLREGVELIFQSFRRVLKDQGVEAIEALEQEFDPTVHEAVGQFPRDGVEPGVVIEVVQQGFRLNDMVLRPSRVIISS
jgi:molecular chaperone GrpE|nr:nucleotide exchange factor GrpE [Candidatus Krumholzibacteria bacterium]